jgi:DNA-binding MurR/RpiR family transcriptional regulator
MGKSFESELAALTQTVEVASALPIEEVASRITVVPDRPVVLVGSGGSFSCAHFGQRLFDQAGAFSTALTPLEFLDSHFLLRKATMVLLSAGGNNKDILSVFTAARQREADRIITITASTNSKLSNT